MMNSIISRVRFKTANNDTNVIICESLEQLQDIGLQLNYEFRKERILVGDQISFDGNRYKIVSVEAYLDGPANEEFPWNFDIICIIVKL